MWPCPPNAFVGQNTCLLKEMTLTRNSHNCHFLSIVSVPGKKLNAKMNVENYQEVAKSRALESGRSGVWV